MAGGNDNLFGDTMESSIDAINKILERIDNSIRKNGSDNNEYLNPIEVAFGSFAIEKLNIFTI